MRNGFCESDEIKANIRKGSMTYRLSSAERAGSREGCREWETS